MNLSKGAATGATFAVMASLANSPMQAPVYHVVAALGGAIVGAVVAKAAKWRSAR